MNTEVRIEQTDWDTHKQDLRYIRETVFIKEQKVPVALEWDEFDITAKHFLAITPNNKTVGCARLLDAGKITRMAVLTPFRHQGIGSALLQTIMQTAKRDGKQHLMLDAQTDAQAFYAKHGFLAHGDIFMDAGIPHIRMTYSITD